MSFAAPVFLAAILAGAIPVLLHLINRQRAPLAPYSTLRFLRLSVEKTRRRKHIHDALLLTLRVAALMLIAIGLAKPTVSRLHHLLGARKATAVAVILDNSASMGVEDQTGPRWQAAQRAAEQLLDLVTEADSAALLPTCGPRLPQARRLYQNLETVRQSLGACQLSPQRADLAMALSEADALLQNAEAPNKEVYLITDMQAASWEGLKAGSGASARPGQPPLILVDVHGQPKPNVGLRRVELHSAAPLAGVPLQGTVELAGDSAVRQQRHVELYLDGKKHEVSPTLSIEPQATVQHHFQFVLQQPGLHRGELRLVGEDACSLDDRLYFAAEINPNIPVAIVQAQPHEIAHLDDTFYLQRALTPAGDADWAIRTTLLTPASLGGRSLAEFAVVFCVNLPALDTAAANGLAQYAAAGGRLVWICGDNVDPVAYSAMHDQTKGQLLPLRLTKVRTPPPDRPDGWRISWLDPAHPALAPLVEPSSLYQSVLVQKHIEMAPTTANDAVRVLARLDDGQPLLVERPVGAGASLLFGASLGVDWTNLPLRPLFVPLLARLTFHLADARSLGAQLVAGSPLSVPLSAATRSVQLTLPSGHVIRQDIEPEQALFQYAETYDVGIYQVEVLEAARTRRVPFAVNVDPSEIDTKVLAADALATRLGDRPLLTCQQPEKLAETIQRLREGESLYELFLLAVLVALAAEPFVANRKQ